MPRLNRVALQKGAWERPMQTYSKGMRQKNRDCTGYFT